MKTKTKDEYRKQKDLAWNIAIFLLNFFMIAYLLIAIKNCIYE